MAETTQIEVYDYMQMSETQQITAMGVQLNQIARVLNSMEGRWIKQEKKCNAEDERIKRVERHIWVGYGVVSVVGIIGGYILRMVFA